VNADRDLRPVPTLDAIAANPAIALELSGDAVKALLVRSTAVNQALLTALLASSSYGLVEPDHLISVDEAAKLIRMSARWIYEHKDELPFTVVVGRAVRCSHRAVMRYIRERRIE